MKEKDGKKRQFDLARWGATLLGGGRAVLSGKGRSEGKHVLRGGLVSSVPGDPVGFKEKTPRAKRLDPKKKSIRAQSKQGNRRIPPERASNLQQEVFAQKVWREAKSKLRTGRGENCRAPTLALRWGGKKRKTWRKERSRALGPRKRLFSGTGQEKGRGSVERKKTPAGKKKSGTRKNRRPCRKGKTAVAGEEKKVKKKKNSDIETEKRPPPQNDGRKKKKGKTWEGEGQRAQEVEGGKARGGKKKEKGE